MKRRSRHRAKRLRKARQAQRDRFRREWRHLTLPEREAKRREIRAGITKLFAIVHRSLTPEFQARWMRSGRDVINLRAAPERTFAQEYSGFPSLGLAGLPVHSVIVDELPLRTEA